MVVGNKCDLENVRVVSTEQGQSFADEHGCKFMETSASDNVNVDEVRAIGNYVLVVSNDLVCFCYSKCYVFCAYRSHNNFKHSVN